MLRIAIVENGVVANVALWDGETEWSFASETLAIPCGPEVGPGDLWDGEAFTRLPPSPPPVPAEVSQYQARMVLSQMGLLATVEALVEAAPDERIKIAWRWAPNIVRASPFVSALASAIGLTETEVDDLFRVAATVS